MRLLPRSLFGRTAVLITVSLLLFSVFAWQALVWSVVMPASTLAVEVLRQRADAALAARSLGQPLPPDTRFEASAPPRAARHLRGSAYATYIEAVRADLQFALQTRDVRLIRFAAPAEFWIRNNETSGTWLVLSWRLAGPSAPLAALGVLGAAALIILGAAAISARRLTAPLAALAAAAARVSEGDEVHIAIAQGPSEVRALALAFQSMSQRLTQVDEQRELMLGGISHDLRTPLARIRVAIELLENQPPELIDEMAASVAEIDRMVGQFLHFVRANYREEPTAAVLDDVVRETLGIYGSDNRLQLHLDAREPRRFAVTAVRHALLNLVQNALEYGVPPVTVRTAVAADIVQLSIEDRGRGLDAGQWREALRPFHRLQPPTQDHTGLGLALVDRLIRSSGGSLTSDCTGQCFIVVARLPALA